MKKKKHLIFLACMSIVVALISFIPDVITTSISIKKGYLFIAFILFLFLILVFYRYLDFDNASFKRLLTTGVTIVFFGLLLSFSMEMVHLSIIGEEGVQQIIDRKVASQIKTETSEKFNIFKIEKEIAEKVRFNGVKDILSLIFGFIGVSILIFIFSLILRTDKKPKEQNPMSA